MLQVLILIDLTPFHCHPPVRKRLFAARGTLREGIDAFPGRKNRDKPVANDIVDSLIMEELNPNQPLE